MRWAAENLYLTLGLQAFWAVALFGGCAVAVNCWLSTEALVYCLKLTESSVTILDGERAQQLKGEVKTITSNGCRKILVSQESAPSGMFNLADEMAKFSKDASPPEVQVLPEDDCSIFFTSGTTGMPKAVLSTQRMFITNLFTLAVAARRATLRRGEDVVVPSPDDPQKVLLLPVPLFHVTGKGNSFRRHQGLY